MKAILKSKPKLIVRFKGGSGSGNYGHSGRPGHVGGSGGGMSHKEYIASLSDEQRNALVDYTIADYKTINNALRAGNATNTTMLDGIIDNAPPLEVSTLYRAVYDKPESIGMEVGSTYTDVAFVSTSASSSYMYKKLPHLNTRIKITGVKGKKGLQLGDAVNRRTKDEKEVLLPRGSSFKIKSITTNEFGKTDVVMQYIG